MIYDIVTAQSVEDIIKKVNERLHKGWELYGDTKMIDTNNYMVYLQPIIKREFVKENKTIEQEPSTVIQMLINDYKNKEK